MAVAAGSTLCEATNVRCDVGAVQVNQGLAT
jgi:hypothetical protein